MFTPRVAVIGASLMGCVAARAARRAGCETILIESRQRLGHDMTATSHEWLENSTGETTVQLGALSRTLLTEQLELGTRVLFNTAAAGILLEGERAAGVVIADPYGMHRVDADLVIDCENTLLSVCPTGEAEYAYNCIINNVHPLLTASIEAPAELGLSDVIRFHSGVRPNSVVMELRLRREACEKDILNPGRVLFTAQRAAEAVFVWLKETEPTLADASLHGFLHAELTLLTKSAPAEAFSGYIPAASAEKWSAFSLRNAAEELGEQIRSALRDLVPAGEADHILTRTARIPMSACKTSADVRVTFRDGFAPSALQIPAEYIPCREEADVTVAGMGTSGIQALQALADCGIRTAGVELCAQPGGTMNLGMVMGYYHGYRDGRNAVVDRAIRSVTEKIGGTPNCAGTVVYAHMLSPIEEHLYFNTLVCGIVRDGRNVRSILCCDAGGLFRIDTKIIIDATGDGVAAMLAGAAYTYGDERDGNAQTYSQWGESLWKGKNFKERRHHGDHDVIDIDSFEDYLRGMYLAQSDNSDLWYSPLLTVRESRRIKGDYILTMDDVWDERIFDDTVAVALTPCDSHGKASCIYMDMGVGSMGRELRARIPYRCYVAADLDNMLVTAKAFSATREANSQARMNADLRNAGYAVGLAAARAILDGCTLREVNVHAVQDELIRQGCLPDWAFEPMPIPDADTLLENAASGSAEALLRLYRAEDTKTKEKIARLYREQPDNALAIRLAAWHGDADAIHAAAAHLAELTDTDGGLYASQHLVRQYTAILQRADYVSAEMLVPVIRHACAGGGVEYTPEHSYYGTIYGQERVDCWKVKHFTFLYLLAGAVERHADPHLADEMDALLDRPYIGGYGLHCGKSPDSPFHCHGIPPFFCSLMEIRLAAAAARCGSEKGMALLRVYTEDDRAILRDFAKAELSGVPLPDICFR